LIFYFFWNFLGVEEMASQTFDNSAVKTVEAQEVEAQETEALARVKELLASRPARETSHSAPQSTREDFSAFAQAHIDSEESQRNENKSPVSSSFNLDMMTGMLSAIVASKAFKYAMIALLIVSAIVAVAMLTDGIALAAGATDIFQTVAEGIQSGMPMSIPGELFNVPFAALAAPAALGLVSGVGLFAHKKQAEKAAGFDSDSAPSTPHI